jgi:methionyl-tRNA formyltransferase
MSLQTLHPSSFDEGIILDQTPWPGIDVPEDCDYPELLQIMKSLGAQMLLKTIRNRLYLPPFTGVGWAENVADNRREYKHAPKIETAHRLLDFETMDSSRMMRMSRAFGSTWAYAAVPAQTPVFKSQRIIFQGPFEILAPSSIGVEEEKSIPEVPPGLPYWQQHAVDDAKDSTNHPLLVNTVDGKTLTAAFMQVEGGVRMPAYQAAMRHRLIGQPRHVNDRNVTTFHKGLATRPLIERMGASC